MRAARLRLAARRRCAALAAATLAPFGSPWFGAPGPAAPPEPALVYDPPADLPAPEAVRATSGQYREIPLRWDPVLIPGVAGYVVEGALAPAGPFRVRATLRDRGVLAWVDRGEPDGAARRRRRALLPRARVRARRSALVDRVARRRRRRARRCPAPPDGLRAWSRQPRSMPLTWDPSRDPVVAGYTVERSPNPAGPFEVVAELDGRQSTHLLDTGLGDLRVLYYRVSSRNLGGERGAPSRIAARGHEAGATPADRPARRRRRLGAIALAWEPNVETDLLGYRLVRWHKGSPPETDHLRRRQQDPRRGHPRGRPRRPTTTR